MLFLHYLQILSVGDDEVVVKYLKYSGGYYIYPETEEIYSAAVQDCRPVNVKFNHRGSIKIVDDKI